MALPSAISFGPHNRGAEVGLNYGTINTEIHLPPERPETPPHPFASIYFSRDPDFVSRGDVLEQIALGCSEPPRRVALVGLGGVGKSQLAIEYAYRVSEADANTWVFWVHAETRMRVEEGFRMIADIVKLPGRNQQKDILQLVYTWLSNERNGKWVMFLDSADDSDVFYSSVDDSGGRPLASHLPQSRNGSIVITTRDGNLASRLTGDERRLIKIGSMTEADALTLLERRLGGLSDTEKSMGVDLLRALDLVPLAISQAAAYIQKRRPRSSLEKYLAEFRKSDKRRAWLLEHDAGDIRRDASASNSVLITWQISFDHIRSKRRSAADLLSLMSFFNRQGIPEEVLMLSKRAYREKLASRYNLSEALNVDGTGVPQIDHHDLDESMDLDTDNDLGSARSDNTANDQFEEDIDLLRAYNLITTNEQGDLFEMHGLVQLSTRKWLEAAGQQETFELEFLERLAASFPEPQQDASNWLACQRLLPHVEMAVDSSCHRSDWGLAVFSKLLRQTGRYTHLRGSYDVAERLYRVLQSVCESWRGKEDIDTAYSSFSLGHILLRKGHDKEAENLAAQAAETSNTLLGPNHPFTLATLELIALTFKSQDRFNEAEELLKPLIEASKTTMGPDDEQTLNLTETYGEMLRQLGRLEEAERLLVHVSEARKIQLGLGHPRTMASMSFLAGVLYEQYRLDEAADMARQVLEARTSTFGPNHPDVLKSASRLASIRHGQGLFAEAETLQAGVAEISKERLGWDHYETQVYVSNWALCLKDLGRLEEAEEMSRQLLESVKRTLRPDHALTLTVTANLGIIRYEQGRSQEGEELLVQAVEGYEAKFGLDHPDILNRMEYLAMILRRQDRNADALALIEKFAQAMQRVYGVEHRLTRQAFDWLEEVREVTCEGR
ncbi:TPR-like protein [Coniochaeta ligniaria NRRL 30616]|uniref:TPR-like protein n=1 Tax=Coniochaeta ligniaria NRRL 30616 TaxID=1408157 RepID=A0A1J7IL35_9PEZI|nr:TPR-like protein [Coniochaeta ligniaria NRRL 30616]